MKAQKHKLYKITHNVTSLTFNKDGDYLSRKVMITCTQTQSTH